MIRNLSCHIWESICLISAAFKEDEKKNDVFVIYINFLIILTDSTLGNCLKTTLEMKTKSVKIKIETTIGDITRTLDEINLCDIPVLSGILLMLKYHKS